MLGGGSLKEALLYPMLEEVGVDSLLVEGN